MNLKKGLQLYGFPNRLQALHIFRFVYYRCVLPVYYVCITHGF